MHPNRAYATSPAVGNESPFFRLHKMHIAHLDRFRSIGRCAIFGFVFLGQKTHNSSHKMHIAHLDRFRAVGRCAIFGFVFLGHKNHKMHIAHLDRSVRLVDVRDSVLYFLARKITRCTSNIWTDSVRLVEMRYQHQAVLKGFIPGRVKGRLTMSC